MVIKWSKDGNRCLEVNFDKFTKKNIFRIHTTHPRKGIDSYFERSVWLLGFKFTYLDVNYDDIVFIELRSENNYTNDENSHNIKVLKEILNNLVFSNTYNSVFTPFNWNYYIQDNNEIIYFITGRKSYFEQNGLDALINGLREITFNDDKSIYFPKYNPFKSNIVNRIYMYQ